jgi:hypothetical protein
MNRTRPIQPILALCCLALLATILMSVRPGSVAAQAPLVSIGSLYASGTSWQKFPQAGGGCSWVGREPEGSYVYAWDTDCGVTLPYVWAYDLYAKGQFDVVLWPDYDAGCGGLGVRAWQWYDGGSWAEYVAVVNRVPSQGGCAFDYYSNSRDYQSGPQLTCQSQLVQMKQRRDSAYQQFLKVINSTDQLPKKRLWHQYNRYDLTFKTCQRILARLGPADFHNSR